MQIGFGDRESRTIAAVVAIVVASSIGLAAVAWLYPSTTTVVMAIVGAIIAAAFLTRVRVSWTWTEVDEETRE